MRKASIAGAAAAAVLAAVVPATSASALPDFPPHQAGWFPVPTPSRDIAAGVLCDAPIHYDAIVDEVVERILTTYPDGSPHNIQFTGPLVVRVINTDTGAFTDVDASGSANVEIQPDGEQDWKVIGPALFGFREGHGNQPRGLYRVDGVYRFVIAANGDRFLDIIHGTQENVCTLID